MSRQVYRALSDLRGFSLKSCLPMPHPEAALFCPPDYYDIVDVKNPFMIGQAGKIDKALARAQWEDVRLAFEDAGKKTEIIDPVRGLEEMVFCSNPVLAGLDAAGNKVCLLSQMRHPSRRREVPAFEDWFKARGYRVARFKDPTRYFEGAGDAVWHPGKRLIWGGFGFRSEAQSYDDVAKAFEAPVILLKLVNERFFHLDTCFCPLTPEAVLIYPAAFAGESLEMILKMFPVVLNASEHEASQFMACNAAVIDGKRAVLPKGSDGVARQMAVMGLSVQEVDTSEYVKSGGSVYGLKLFLY
ncbi:MAG: dimethylarginine dimethylaminohydrolase family protein [Elusimicrobiota bacterium]